MLIHKNCLTLRELMKKQCVMLPGAYNGMVARQAALHGFQGLYISGAAVTASTGVPDIGMVTLDGFTKVIKEVVLASGLPVIADADTGFGEGEMCSKTVWEYYMAGASGLHIEDQVFPKRCGHLDGKELIPVDTMVKKIEIAVESSKKCSDGAFIICARTDARGVEGVENCISRGKAYIDAGADMIFPEGLQSVQEMEYVAQHLKAYNQSIFLLANMTEFGKTPYISRADLQKMGYSCAIYPVSTLRIASQATNNFLATLIQEETQANTVDKMQTRKELYETIGYTPGKEWIYPNSIKK